MKTKGNKLKRYLGKKKLLRIYVDNTDLYKGEPLWQKLIEKAKDSGLAGATVFKAVAGVGVHTQIHTSSIWSLAQKLPLIIEIIDDEDKIMQFLKNNDIMIGEGLVTLTDVEVLRYKKSSKEPQ